MTISFSFENATLLLCEMAILVCRLWHFFILRDMAFVIYGHGNSYLYDMVILIFAEHEHGKFAIDNGGGSGSELR